MLVALGTETSSAAPSKAVSGTATTSASGASARATSAFQPETRTLQVSTSVTMASSATREITNTGSAAGWSARSTNGSRAMIFGAPSASSAAPPRRAARRVADTSAEIALGSRHRLDRGLRAEVRDERHREAEMEARAESRIAGSPTERSACTANGACTKVKVEMMTRQMLSVVS